MLCGYYVWSLAVEIVRMSVSILYIDDVSQRVLCDWKGDERLDCKLIQLLVDVVADIKFVLGANNGEQVQAIRCNDKHLGWAFKRGLSHQSRVWGEQKKGHSLCKCSIGFPVKRFYLALERLPVTNVNLQSQKSRQALIFNGWKDVQDLIIKPSLPCVQLQEAMQHPNILYKPNIK